MSLATAHSASEPSSMPSHWPTIPKQATVNQNVGGVVQRLCEFHDLKVRKATSAYGTPHRRLVITVADDVVFETRSVH